MRKKQMNETMKTINNRTSLRRFSNEKVSIEEQDIIINAALRAPTAGNLMLYSILKIEDKETLEKLSVSCDQQPFIATASFALVFLVDFQRMYDYFSYNNFFSYCKEQDSIPKLPDLSDLLLGSEDAICAAQNSVIAAESINIGSCYIGDIIENYEFHKSLFKLEKLTFPLGMLVFGKYPDNYKPQVRERFNRKFVVFNDTYQRLSKEELDKMFEHQAKEFVQNNKFEAKNYAQYLYARKFGSDFANEMRRSVNLAYEEWLSYGKEVMKFF